MNTLRRMLPRVGSLTARNLSSTAVPVVDGKLGVVGGGRMAEAILRCLAKSQNMKSVHVYDPNETRMSVLKARYGITPVDTPEDATYNAEFVVRRPTSPPCIPQIQL